MRANQRKSRHVSLNNQEERLLSYVGNEPIHITTLVEKVSSEFSIGQIHQLLLSLELKRVITQQAGQHYVRRECRMD
jgi:predicted Rossmann fold nucleotide-binding protein DprA/Smf involved in DNA uptake